jgi:beta-fructofuranosidase
VAFTPIQANPLPPRLMLYRQTSPNDLLQNLHWTYLGPLLSPSGLSSFSEWNGNFGINFETSAVTRLNEHGMAYDDGNDPRALNIIGLGTEQGRNGTHENHWPLCEFLSCRFLASDCP